MSILIIASVILGIITGALGFAYPFIDDVEVVSMIALNILLFGVGIDIGRNKDVWKKIKKLGFKTLLLPSAIAVGSIVGSASVFSLLKMPFNHALSVGAGFGWYSLSGVLLKQLAGTELGTIAFLANVFRELLAILFLPFLGKYLGKVVAVAPCGATSMDTTLPLISKTLGSDIAVIAFINGVVLSLLVPLLVPVLFNLGS